MNNLHKKILDKTASVILFELLPPSESVGNGEYLKDYAQSAVELLLGATINIDAINIPEIHDEKNGSGRPSPYVPKIEPRELALHLKQVSNNKLDIILNRSTVHFPWEEQKKWLEETIVNYHNHTFVLIGAESAKNHYPGPSVIDLASYIKKNRVDCLCGGIVIQHRRKPILEQDEINRLFTKAQHGIEFFTSQIIYEAESVKILLKDYQQFCESKNIKPKRIILSFAPISNPKDIEFLRWLGVSIPEVVCQKLLKSTIGISWRSVKTANTALEEVLDFISRENIQVPLGINIEHITPRNFDISQMLVEILGSTYLSMFS